MDSRQPLGSARPVILIVDIAGVARGHFGRQEEAVGGKVDEAGPSQGLAERLLGGLRTTERDHGAVRIGRGEMIAHQSDFAARAGKWPKLHESSAGRRASNASAPSSDP